VLAVEAVAVEVDAPRRGGVALAVLAVAVEAVELDARLDAAALACGACRRCRCRRAGHPPRRGGAVLADEAVAVELDASTRRRCPAVLAVEAAAVELDARLDVAALPSRCCR
jgi:hypothetical protein